jgi:cupin superfamily acireductone dioxygenase involved in methionine salvage
LARKKSVKRVAWDFQSKADGLISYLETAKRHFGDEHQSWSYEYAIIRLYREFENLIVEAIVGAINNSTETLSNTVGVRFPKHLTDEVCEYLVLGNGYFDFKGRDGLIKRIREYVPENHYLVTTVRNQAYKEALEQLSALRNFAAHDSYQSKRAALKAIGLERVGSAGSWLKCQNRFDAIVTKMKDLAQEIYDAAPY